jgi:hypothetical protein
LANKNSILHLGITTPNLQTCNQNKQKLAKLCVNLVKTFETFAKMPHCNLNLRKMLNPTHGRRSKELKLQQNP